MLRTEEGLLLILSCSPRMSDLDTGVIRVIDFLDVKRIIRESTKDECEYSKAVGNAFQSSCKLQVTINTAHM